jgi:predicted transcriptional regulator
MAKPTNDELRAIIGARLSDTLNTSDSELRADREKALDFYYGRPMGNEIEGRAQVVSKDLMDTIEWMMPSLMRVFATKDAVQFDPVGAEDELAAKQETAYVSHVLWKKNPGFMLIYNWIKDGLMQKVGYVKYWWQDEEKACYDEYSGLTDDQLIGLYQELQQQGEVEPVGSEQAEDGTWSVKFRITKKYGCANLEVIPPEEIIVDSKCRGSVKNANMVGHLRRLTNSELIQMGFSKKQLKALSDYVLPERTGEALARDTVNESIDDSNMTNAQWATTERLLLECYTYIDADDDGIAELRHFLMGGNDFLIDEEFPEIPLESWTPVPIPHRHVGLSIYDLMEDLQRIKTALQRGMLDNVYFTMNPRLVYDKNTIGVASLQVNRPGGHIENDGPPGMSLMPIQYAPMAGQIMQVIDYMDAVKETRTGVGRMTSGVDADVLAQSTKGAYSDAKSAANQRIEAIARIFAEVGLGPLYASLHRLLLRHQDWSAKFKLKSDWVDVNPAEWQERANLSVAVGLGNSSKDEIRQNLVLMAQAQEKLATGDRGLVQPKNMYALFMRMATELGFENDGYATDPSSPEYKQFASQPPPPDPYVEGKKVEAQTKQQESMIDATFKDRELAQERDLAITKMELDYATDLAKAGIGAEVAIARGAQQASSKRPAAPGQPAPSGSV